MEREACDLSQYENVGPQGSLETAPMPMSQLKLPFQFECSVVQ